MTTDTEVREKLDNYQSLQAKLTELASNGVEPTEAQLNQLAAAKTEFFCVYDEIRKNRVPYDPIEEDR